jgi:epsilon-lactone hydrolase
VPSPELTELLDLVRGGRAAMAGRVVAVEEHRARYRKLGALMPMRDGVVVDRSTLGGIAAERLVPAAADLGDGAAVVYLHGGGYCIGGPDTHRSVCSHLAAEVGCPVLAVDYRLAPEHPAAGLTAVTAMALRDAGDPVPATAVLISPWTDVAGGWPSYESRAAVDSFVFPESLTELAGWYLAGHDPRDPRVSPLHGDLAGLPPTLVHVGDHECLLDDATVMGERLAAAGVEVTVEVWPEMVHVWHFFAGRVPEADAAIAAISRWLRPRLGLGG